MAEHSINLGHNIQLQDSTILSTRPRYMDWLIREAIKIELHLNNTNGGGGGGRHSAGHLIPLSLPSKNIQTVSCSIASSDLTTRPYWSFQDIAYSRPIPYFLSSFLCYFFHSLPVYFLLCPRHICQQFCMPANPPSGPSEALIRADSFNFFVSQCSALTDLISLSLFPHAWLTHHPDDGGSKDCSDVGELIPSCVALLCRRQPSSFFVSGFHS
jgi:hypothetical protein